MTSFAIHLLPTVSKNVLTIGTVIEFNGLREAAPIEDSTAIFYIPSLGVRINMSMRQFLLSRAKDASPFVKPSAKSNYVDLVSEKFLVLDKKQRKYPNGKDAYKLNAYEKFTEHWVYEGRRPSVLELQALDPNPNIFDLENYLRYDFVFEPITE